MPHCRSRFATVLAMLAMALQGCWPLLAQGRHGAPDIYGSICTIDGAAAVELQGKFPAQGGAGKQQKHCILCVAGGDRAQALVPPQVEGLRTPAFVAEPPASGPSAFYRSAQVSLAQPRAPPGPA